MIAKFLQSKFIPHTTAQWMRIGSIILAVADVPLAIGGTLTGLPDALKWLSAYWPAILAVAAAIHQLASTFGLSADAGTAAALASGVQEARVVLNALAAAQRAVTNSTAINIPAALASTEATATARAIQPQ